MAEDAGTSSSSCTAEAAAAAAAAAAGACCANRGTGGASVGAGEFLRISMKSAWEVRERGGWVWVLIERKMRRGMGDVVCVTR